MITALIVVFIAAALFAIGSLSIVHVLKAGAEEMANDQNIAMVIYSEKDDQWFVVGDIDTTTNKMLSHYKEPRIIYGAK